ncbi:uncharacterized protein LOC123562579 isoform X2 [Mercenaria mercenaria]|uniref:uncharacterized protein LOC123562579 isoform X2 n=1 Tax=Mercenaria mercenaria TaxID=6596 RepID=UPI00234E870D|nr:uncharacterized protein LOC123562579 isoform X2 [Mercenaria mercenaria]
MEACYTDDAVILDSVVIGFLVLLVVAVLISIWLKCTSFHFISKYGNCSSEADNCEAGNSLLGRTEHRDLRNEKLRVDALRRELTKEKEEKEDALKRLSAIMSSRLRDGNPNVVDLSDQNRPIKVGEQFSELYDNQWTDAFSAMETYFGTSKQESELISMLLDILQQCFTVCTDKAHTQLKQLNENVNNLAASITKKTSKLPADLMQRIKEERKMFASDHLPDSNMMLPILKDYFSSRVLDIGFLEENSLKAFMRECLKLSWLMVIQDPPMTMVMKPEDQEYENFKAYKTRGRHLAFVVWPALLLEEGGPLIMKGIAEFYDVYELSDEL